MRLDTVNNRCACVTGCSDKPLGSKSDRSDESHTIKRTRCGSLGRKDCIKFHGRRRRFLEYVPCAESIGKGNEFELIPTVNGN